MDEIAWEILTALGCRDRVWETACMAVRDRHPAHELRAEVVLEYAGVVKRFGATTALDGVSFS